MRAVLLLATAVAITGIAACTTPETGHARAASTVPGSGTSVTPSRPRPWTLKFTEHGTDVNGHPFTNHFVVSMTTYQPVHGGVQFSSTLGKSIAKIERDTLTADGQFENKIGFRANYGPAQINYDSPGFPLIKFPIFVGQRWDTPGVTGHWFKGGTRTPYPFTTSETDEVSGRIVAEKDVSFQGQHLTTFVIDLTETGVQMNGDLVSSNFTITGELTYVPAYAWVLSSHQTMSRLTVSGQHVTTDSVQADGFP